MKHTPLEIEVILHYFYSYEPHPQVDAPAVRQVIEQFCVERLLWYDAQQSRYVVTERGQAWVDMICSMPYPVWVDPTEWNKPDDRKVND